MSSVPGTGEAGGLFAALRSTAASLVATARTRVELVGNELETERLRLVRSLVFGISALFCFGVGLLMLIPAAAFKAWSIPFLVAQQFLGDFGIMIFTILAVSLQQKLLPEDELARANGFNQVVNGLGMTVSILIAGWIAETIGVANTVMLGSGIGVIGIFPLMTRHLLGIREEPAGRDEEVLQAAG